MIPIYLIELDVCIRIPFFVVHFVLDMWHSQQQFLDKVCEIEASPIFMVEILLRTLHYFYSSMSDEISKLCTYSFNT